MKVEILTIGDELLLGLTTDSNTPFLGRELARIGVDVTRHSTVRDDAAEIIREVRAALDRSGALITSGGLGPTSDDLSVQAVAQALGLPLLEDASVISAIERRFRARGQTGRLPDSSRRQALVPAGAQVLPNRNGTAPGLLIEDGSGRWLAMLPGVPSELRGLFFDQLEARLRTRVASDAATISRTLRTTGIAESALADLIDRSGIQTTALAYLPGVEGVDLRVTVRNRPLAEAQRQLERDMAALRSVVGAVAYGEDETDLAAVVLDLAKAHSLRIAVAESCTGGMLGARLSAVAGASDVFVGGIVSYTNDLKERLLGVPQEMLRAHGAVSEVVARAMASGARRRTGAEVALAITGIAGPSGATEGKPVGTVWVCAAIGDGTTTAKRVFPGSRDEVRRRATQLALDTARRHLPSRPAPASAPA
jgi:nicotinamide-nucleotide amidase